jgi:RNA polymerase sigma factor (TIGR02999 family)
MSDVTQLLDAVEKGDPHAAAELLPLVYAELRKLAARHLANERPGQTLQPTALVHEAYLRLVGPANAGGFASRRHFFGAAAEAMRRILVESARRKQILPRIDLDVAELACAADDRLLLLDDALGRLARDQPGATELVRLKLFAGLSVEEAAAVLGVSRAEAYREWAYARAWLSAELGENRAAPETEPGPGSHEG